MWVIEQFYHKEKFLIIRIKFLFAVWHNLWKKYNNFQTNLIKMYIFFIKYLNNISYFYDKAWIVKYLFKM